MAADLANMRRILAARAHKAGTLEALKTYAETLKTLAEAEKAEKDLANQAKLLRQEKWKTFATAIVPLLTVATLAVTIYFQWAQAQITANANEDAQWRGLADVMSKPAGPTSDVVITTGLIPFFQSDRYSYQAHEVAFLLARRVTDFNTFRALYDAAVGPPMWQGAFNTVRMGRAISQAYFDMSGAFNLLGGMKQLQDEMQKPRTTIAYNTEGLTVEQAGRIQNELLLALNYLTVRAGELLRLPRPASGLLPYTDFSGFAFYEADLGRIDFAGLDLTNAIFYRVAVDGANLSPVRFDGSTWGDTRWWAAARISPALLAYLIKNAAPYASPDDAYRAADGSEVVVSRDDYVKALGEQCARAKIACDPANAAFGAPGAAAGAEK